MSKLESGTWSCWYCDQSRGQDHHFGIADEAGAREWLKKQADKGQDVWIFDPQKNKYLPDGRVLTPEEQKAEREGAPKYQGLGTFVRRTAIPGTIPVEALQYGSLDGTETQVLPQWLVKAHASGAIYLEDNKTFFMDIVGSVRIVHPSDWFIFVNGNIYQRAHIEFVTLYMPKPPAPPRLDTVYRVPSTATCFTLSFFSGESETHVASDGLTITTFTKGHNSAKLVKKDTSCVGLLEVLGAVTGELAKRIQGDLEEGRMTRIPNL